MRAVREECFGEKDDDIPKGCQTTQKVYKESYVYAK